MSMIHRAPIPQQHGFTLIETLVAMISGVVVTGATFSVLIVSLHQTSRITDSVQATQLGRTAMTHVIDELHSVCLARKFSPVQENSSDSKLIFVNAYSKESVISKTEAYEHEIEWSGEATQKLTDTVTSASGGQWPNFHICLPPRKQLSSPNTSPRRKVTDLSVLQVCCNRLRRQLSEPAGSAGQDDTSDRRGSICHRSAEGGRSPCQLHGEASRRSDVPQSLGRIRQPGHVLVLHAVIRSQNRRWTMSVIDRIQRVSSPPARRTGSR